MQLSKYSPSIINIKENPHKVHNRRKRKRNISNQQKMAKVNEHPPTHYEGWMINDQGTVFCSVSVPQLTMVVTSVACFNYLPTNNPQAGCQQVGSKNGLNLCINHLLLTDSLSHSVPKLVPSYDLIKHLFLNSTSQQLELIKCG